MISVYKKCSNLVVLLGFASLLLFACKKDKVSKPLIPPPVMVSKWEKIPGHYKVYDTLGVFMYEMDILHSDTTLPDNTHIDSLHYIGFDGQFNFTAMQTSFSNWPVNNVRIGVHNPVIDSNNNRFRIFGYGPIVPYNNFKNDTIIFYFEKQNILYYLHDLVPYYYCNCKHVAVKQH